MFKNGQPDNLLDVAALIERYIGNHPKRMNSFECILDWWRTQEKLEDAAMTVTDALSLLM